MKIVVDTSFEVLEALLKAYVPVFNAMSKQPMPTDYASKRAKQLWKNAVKVLVFRMVDEESGHILGGTLLVEVSRDAPPEFIPDHIFQQVLEIAGPNRRLFYHTASFKTPKCTRKDVSELHTSTERSNRGCHFYATINPIKQRVSPKSASWIGYEDWLDERRNYYCFNSREHEPVNRPIGVNANALKELSSL